MNYQETWRSIIKGKGKSWVVFENNTCVILMEPEEDLANQAIELLKEFGPYVVGTSSADMNVITLSKYPGWVVRGHHNDILNYLAPEEVEPDPKNTISIGILGRHNRSEDAKALKIMHIEDNRN